MHAAAERLHSKPDIGVVEQTDAWIVRVPKTEGIFFTVTIPKSVLEWFASATDGTREVWSDWADYYPTQGESRVDLEADMAADIEWFILTLLACSVRVANANKKTSLEWELNGEWQKLHLSAA
jgi:hypothetical protein